MTTFTKKLVTLGLALAMMLTGGLLHAQEDASEVLLLIGEQKTIDVSGVSSVAVGEKKIASAKLIGNQLLVTGKSAGLTTLNLIRTGGDTDSFTLKVLARDPKVVRDEVAVLLEEVEGIELKVVGDRVFIDGYVYREMDRIRTEKIASIYPEVVNLTTFSRAYITIHRLVQVDYNRYEIFKRDSMEMGLNWKDLLGFTFGDASYNRLIRGGDPVQSTITAIDPNSGRVIGHDPTYEENGHGGQVMVTSSNFNPLKLNQDDNRIRLMDNHQAIVQEGEVAYYQVGGEFPIPIIFNDTINVVYKNFGAIFRVIAELDKQDNVDMNISMELSSLDEDLTVNGYPGLLKIMQRTNVTLRAGESVVIGGYMIKEIGKGEDGLPGLSQVPILGYVFGKKSFTTENREGVVFITPTVLTPVADPQEDPKIRGVLEEFNKDDFRL